MMGVGVGVGQALQGAPAQVPLPVHLLLLTEQTRGPPALCAPHPAAWESSSANLPLQDLPVLQSGLCWATFGEDASDHARGCPLQAASAPCPAPKPSCVLYSFSVRLHNNDFLWLFQALAGATSEEGVASWKPPSPPAFQPHWAALLLPLRSGLWASGLLSASHWLCPHRADSSSPSASCLSRSSTTQEAAMLLSNLLVPCQLWLPWPASPLGCAPVKEGPSFLAP